MLIQREFYKEFLAEMLHSRDVEGLDLKYPSMQS